MKRKENGNTKQKIYETAKRLYIEHGYFNISNKRLSEESGINQGLKMCIRDSRYGAPEKRFVLRYNQRQFEMGR